ncbi:MAG: hypothetical protein BJ554DRAFT_8340 [Olpidium bornovanus]|uniref:Cyclin N-terminal domain-containing protein n=1 Tax=Olpidium bornovanus TaxID=278681 RepID=A0A8H7ZV33_9FUNG|nr:MAG: hypothetical protein BJ554DRAFT_8340 [Olpidium bornovanus]
MCVRSGCPGGTRPGLAPRMPPVLAGAAAAAYRSPPDSTVFAALDSPPPPPPLRAPVAPVAAAAAADSKAEARRKRPRPDDGSRGPYPAAAAAAHRAGDSEDTPAWVAALGCDKEAFVEHLIVNELRTGQPITTETTQLTRRFSVPSSPGRVLLLATVSGPLSACRILGLPVLGAPRQTKKKKFPAAPGIVHPWRSFAAALPPSAHDGSATRRSQKKKKKIQGHVVDVISRIWPEQQDPCRGAEAARGSRSLPLHQFVREALRRSRTSFWTLQTALVYLIRAKTGLYAYKQLRRAATPVGPATVAAPCATPSLRNCEICVGPRAAPDAAATRDMSEAESPHRKRRPVACFTANGVSQLAQVGSLPVAVAPAAAAAAGRQPGRSPADLTQCGRRMFIAALMVASKYLRDCHYSNKAWATMSGLYLWEVNRLEVTFLKLISYRLHVSLPIYARASALLFHQLELCCTRARAYTLQVAAAAAAESIASAHCRPAPAAGYRQCWPDRARSTVVPA